MKRIKTDDWLCPHDNYSRQVRRADPPATTASIQRRNWQHSAAYLADHAEHVAWMMTPQPDLTRNDAPLMTTAD